MLFTACYKFDCDIESAESWKGIILGLRHIIYLVSTLIAPKTHLTSMIGSPCKNFSIVLTLMFNHHQVSTLERLHLRFEVGPRRVLIC